MKINSIELSQICTKQTQTRAELRRQAVGEYAELIRNGEEMEPAADYDVNGQLHLAAGHHPYAAYSQAGKSNMPCELRKGSLCDAIEHGIRNNPCRYQRRGILDGVTQGSL